MLAFEIMLHRTGLGGPVRVTPRINAFSETHLLTDGQLRKRLALINPAETDKIFANLSYGRGEHRLNFTAEQWPILWSTEEAFLQYWRPNGRLANP